MERLKHMSTAYEDYGPFLSLPGAGEHMYLWYRTAVELWWINIKSTLPLGFSQSEDVFNSLFGYLCSQSDWIADAPKEKMREVVKNTLTDVQKKSSAQGE